MDFFHVIVVLPILSMVYIVLNSEALISNSRKVSAKTVC
ncbi:hypothetical protein T01_8522 [Trichinella spiralis]|uniref:Uncharacterized protein n=1 Tax=Trichinella spiralis TaxID=6334 RepID=A0A0V0XD32_TRISP|nr:hypothetical protein T01_8522 [Trichinella spiralis]